MPKSKNGANGQGKGGGPNTEKGMAIARLNALKHGFAVRSPIIPGMEDDDEWKRHRDGIAKSLQPEGYLEEVLARRIATALWQLDRLTAYEVASILSHIVGTAFDRAVAANYLSGSDDVVEPDPWDVAEHQQGRLLPPEGDLNRVMRYGSHHHRKWIQTLHELQALQALRRGSPFNVLRVDHSGPPSP